MTDSSPGQVVTFYSYKGGTGRTMAMANVAWILAASGKRVLVVDWDLESPGLHRYFKPFINQEALANTGGVIDLIREYEQATAHTIDRRADWHRDYAQVRRHAFSVDWEFADGGQLDFLGAGRQNNNYAATLSGMNWDDFYERLGGGLFFDALREDMKNNYDYALIDSRTGLSDIADICTVHMPDILVDCFTYSEQGIDGAAEVARTITEKYATRNIRILPVPMRVDLAEKFKLDTGREVAMRRFAGLPDGLIGSELDTYWRSMQVPYQPFYAYEETLATFGDAPGERSSLLASYEALTAHITNGVITALPPMNEQLRMSVSTDFIRRAAMVEDELVLQYEWRDQVWADWIQSVLTSARIRVIDASGAGDPATSPNPGASAQRLIIFSPAGQPGDVVATPNQSAIRTPLAAYVADMVPLPNVPLNSSAHLAGVSEEAAIERLMRLVGRTLSPDEPTALRPRFPGVTPAVFNMPARNSRFTGREADLRNLRDHLRRFGSAVVLPGSRPVALHGMGGIGKSQVATEYAYRFGAAYDVVWWIAAEQIAEVEFALSQLGVALGLNIAAGPNSTRAIVQALANGEPYRRWLLIFDNAEDPELLEPYIPSGPGHVLVTSRNPQWNNVASAIAINVFQRKESIALLRLRLPKIRYDGADRIAELLGDLPIAVAAAAAWLYDTGALVDDYIHQIEQHGPGALETETGQSRSVEATWDLSLQLLEERSPAALRLLKMLSLMAPEIALDVVYSDPMANALKSYSPDIALPLVRASLVQQINRLALLRIDQRTAGSGGWERGQIIVHRLLQFVVRDRMTEEQREEINHQIHLVLGECRPAGEVEDPETWPRYRMLWPHLAVSNAFTCPDDKVQQLLIDQVRYMWQRGELDRGLELADRVEKAWTEMLESFAPEQAHGLRRQLLHLRFNKANLNRDKGSFKESRDLDEAVLLEQTELLGPNHPHTLMTAGSLAADLRGLGRYREALALDEQTYTAWFETVGEAHPRTLTALSNLAVSYRLIGRLREALKRDEIAYSQRQLALPPDHSHTLVSATNLGRDLREAGYYERSITLLRLVHSKYIGLFGIDSRNALNAQANLAISLRNGGRPRDAAVLLERSYGQLNDLLGPESPDTLAARLSMSVNLLELEEYDRARQEMNAVRDAYEQKYGPDHPHTLVCSSNLAALLRAMDDPASAKEYASDARVSLARVLGDDHPYTIAAFMNLAIACADGGDGPEAIAAIREASERITRALGPDHPHTLRCRANEQIIMLQFGSGGSVTQLSEIIGQLAQRIGARHPAITALREDRRLLRRIIDPHPF